MHANIISKLNLKLRGANHYLMKQKSGIGDLGISDTMFIGVDLTHPSPGSPYKHTSIAAVVTNSGSRCSQWPASTGYQDDLDNNSKEVV